ncbi:hypothetical protein DENSPDRAFT_635849 [Dentipellis sp. KUC8613]|nr:hypothetical protein DENSPDRAFT_635849 [Dentipellis sp. KUC8613]
MSRSCLGTSGPEYCRLGTSCACACIFQAASATPACYSVTSSRRAREPPSPALRQRFMRRDICLHHPILNSHRRIQNIPCHSGHAVAACTWIASTFGFEGLSPLGHRYHFPFGDELPVVITGDSDMLRAV